MRGLWSGLVPACVRVGGGAGALPSALQGTSALALAAYRSAAANRPHGPKAKVAASRLAALYFTCLDRADHFLRGLGDVSDSAVLTNVRTFALGSFSRSVAAVVFCPITVVKTRMARLSRRCPQCVLLCRPRVAAKATPQRGSFLRALRTAGCTAAGPLDAIHSASVTGQQLGAPAHCAPPQRCLGTK